MSEKEVLTTIKCRFSLLDEGRKYSGQHRKYVIENAREICYSPETREKIKLREALGYYGHGRRVIARKMELQEVEPVKLPDGTEILMSNIPSNVTVEFDITKDGIITHSQDILDTKAGAIVESLNKSHVGGFSWACPGEDGGKTRPTRLTGFSGFDYVLQPGFAKNRGYVLESAYSETLFEAVNAVVGNEAETRKWVEGWRYNCMDNEYDSFNIEDKYFDIEDRMNKLGLDYMRTKEERDAYRDERDTYRQQLDTERERSRRIAQTLEDLPFFISEKSMHQLMEGDFSKACTVLEAARRVDFSQYPNMPFRTLEESKQSNSQTDFGTAGYGFKIKL